MRRFLRDWLLCMAVMAGVVAALAGLGWIAVQVFTVLPWWGSGLILFALVCALAVLTEPAYGAGMGPL